MKKYFIQKAPFVVPTTDGKLIEEHHGLATTNNSAISIAHMIAPPGWSEPFQTPEFDEYTLVLNGMLRVETRESIFDVKKGQAIITYGGEWIRYSSPNPEGAEYVAVCIPAFSPDTVHRDK